MQAQNRLVEIRNNLSYGKWKLKREYFTNQLPTPQQIAICISLDYRPDLEWEETLEKADMMLEYRVANPAAKLQPHHCAYLTEKAIEMIISPEMKAVAKRKMRSFREKNDQMELAAEIIDRDEEWHYRDSKQTKKWEQILRKC